MISRNQGLSSNDQGRQRRETLGTRLRIKYMATKLSTDRSLETLWQIGSIVQKQQKGKK